MNQQTAGGSDRQRRAETGIKERHGQPHTCSGVYKSPGWLDTIRRFLQMLDFDVTRVCH